MKDNFWVEESSPKQSDCKKRKRRIGKRIIEFIGWGSRPLIEFLETIAKDTTTKLTRHEVVALITKYVNDKGLTNPTKKRRILCDEKLFALFGKKSLPRAKIFERLEEHFAENHDDSSDDELSDSSDEEYHRKKKSNPQMKKDYVTPKSSFASVIPENIKLIYLKRTLIQEFLKVPESFESKILGSFVRLRSDPKDIYQKNRCQLQLVTGVEMILEGGGTGGEILLKLANYFKAVPVNSLSEDNFTEEDIEDLRERIKSGALRRPTVVELELKAQMLHADITNHWIAKEIPLLKRRIDHANERGRRKELFEHVARRKQLTTPSEVEKLLLAIPKVIAEDLEPEAVEAAAPLEVKWIEDSPKSIRKGSSDVSGKGASVFEDQVAPSRVSINDSHTPEEQNANTPLECIGDLVAPCQVIIDDSNAPKGRNGDLVINNDSHSSKEQNGYIVRGGMGDLVAPSQVIISDSHASKGQNGNTLAGVILGNNLNGHQDGYYETSKQVKELQDELPELIRQRTRQMSEIIGKPRDVNPRERISEERTCQRPTQIIEINRENSGEAHDVPPPERISQEKSAQQPTQVIAIDDESSGEAQDVIPLERNSEEKTSQLPTQVIAIDNESGGDELDVIPLEIIPQVESEQEPTSITFYESSSEAHASEERIQQPPEVIALSSDDEDDKNESVRSGGKIEDEGEWNYADPHGRTQGPFKLASLKRWNASCYFDPGFKVWRNGQSPDDAVLLADVLRQYFPGEV